MEAMHIPISTPARNRRSTELAVDHSKNQQNQNSDYGNRD
jgi:hypothetical protein